jgi:hypothetical protein
MADIAFDVLVETGVRIQPLPAWNGEWEHPNRYSNPHRVSHFVGMGAFGVEAFNSSLSVHRFMLKAISRTALSQAYWLN